MHSNIVQKRLIGLNEQQLRDLAEAIKAKLSLCSKLEQETETTGKEDADIRIVLESIALTLATLGVEFSDASLHKRDHEYRQFAKHVPQLMQFVRRHASNRNEQRVLLRLGVRVLYHNMTKAGIPTTALVLRRHIHRIPAVLNAAFPSYASSGLLGPMLRGSI